MGVAGRISSTNGFLGYLMLRVIAPGRPSGVWPQEEQSLNLWGKAHLSS